MKQNKVNFQKIKDWFIIQRIRLLNFIKEHKYVSAGIGVFLATCIIVIVAFAGDDPYKGKITVVSDDNVASGYKSATISNLSAAEDGNYMADSFTQVSYKVSFKLACDSCGTEKPTNRSVIITASIPSNIDASWVAPDDLDAKLSVEEKDGFNTLTINMFDVDVSDAIIEKTIYLDIKNVSNETILKPTINIKESTAQSETSIDTSKTQIKVSSEELSLTSKIITGYKYKDDSYNYAPFGIILGYTCSLNDGNCLKGKYINPNQTIALNLEGTAGTTLLIEENKYGVFDSNENSGIISKDKMPNYKFDSSLNLNVYDSGTVASLSGPDSSSNFELKIKDLKTSSSIYYQDGKFVGLGSYYVIAKTNRTDASVTLNGTTMKNLNEDSKGTQKITYTLLNENNESTFAYGEVAYLNAEFSHSIDSAADLENATISVPIDSNFVLEKYDSENDYYINKEYKNYVDESGNEQNFVDTLYESCIVGDGTDECDTYSTYDEAIKDDKIIEKIHFSLPKVKKGVPVNIKLRLKVKNYAKDGANTYSDITASADTALNLELSEPSKYIITPFKMRTTASLNDKGTNTTVDITNGGMTNVKLYPSLYAPSVRLTPTYIQNGYFDFILVQVDLPDGLNYVENSSNMDYTYYTNNSKINRLNFLIRYLDYNKSVDSINFNIIPNIDVSGEKQINIKSQAISVYKSLPALEIFQGMQKNVDVDEITKDKKNSLIDASTLKERTSTLTVNYLSSSNNIIARNNASNTYVNPDEKFSFETELYNPSSTSKSASLILEMPSNDSSSETYTGSYSISNIPKDALCAFEYNNIGDIKEWNECPDEPNNSNVKYIKIDDINLESKAIQKIALELNPVNNKVGDKYKYTSYIKEDADYKKISSTTISVSKMKISGNVWEDFNGDGLIDDDEEKIEGIKLYLHKIEKDNETLEITSDEVVATTLSNYKGDYEFLSTDDGGEIEAGSYYIEARFLKEKYGLTAYREDIINNYNKSVFKSATISEEDEDYELYTSAKTDSFEVTLNTKKINDMNLGLSLNKIYKVKVSKYLTRAVTTNALGISTTKEFGDKVTFAKLDVKDINNLTIKVVYTIELENTGYYPGYIYAIDDFIPSGMSFNPNYEENKGWSVKEEGILQNNSLKDTLIKGGEKKYVTLALDIVSKEAGTFVNYASVSEENTKIFSDNNSLLESGDINE